MMYRPSKVGTYHRLTGPNLVVGNRTAIEGQISGRNTNQTEVRPHFLRTTVDNPNGVYCKLNRKYASHIAPFSNWCLAIPMITPGALPPSVRDGSVDCLVQFSGSISYHVRAGNQRNAVVVPVFGSLSTTAITNYPQLNTGSSYNAIDTTKYRHLPVQKGVSDAGVVNAFINETMVWNCVADTATRPPTDNLPYFFGWDFSTRADEGSVDAATVDVYDLSLSANFYLKDTPLFVGG